MAIYKKESAMKRHRLPANFWLHMVGIPMALAGVVLLFVDFWWGLGAFVAGYVLQYIGHRLEGNDLGEWAGIKRLLGLPCVGISPRWEVKDEGSGMSDQGAEIGKG